MAARFAGGRRIARSGCATSYVARLGRDITTVKHVNGLGWAVLKRFAMGGYMSESTIKLDPIPSILIESMRDIGYTFEVALADIVDNSISASAKTIRIETRNKPNPIVAVIDDGEGLSGIELKDSMRLGSMDPRVSRSLDDLGRFGLGLKTASFSQCRKLTVVSKRGDEVSGFVWDLNHVVDKNEWELLVVEDFNAVPFFDLLGDNGTLVVWEDLDRLGEASNVNKRNEIFTRTVSEAEEHIALVFHRFLTSEPGHKKITMLLNGRAIEAVDPFNTKHPATMAEPEETAAQGVKIQAFTLPHHTKYATQAEYDKYGLRGGYTKNQGIYLYRARRLIIYGTWFNLSKKSQLTQLCRVRIDIDNQHDDAWKIDVKKVSAQLPEDIRSIVKNFLERYKRPSRGVYRRRGAKVTSAIPYPIWETTKDNGRITYSVNRRHPIITGFIDYLNDEYEQRRFELVLKLIESSFPIDSVFYELSEKPESVFPPRLENTDINLLARTYFTALKTQQLDEDDIIDAMRHTKIFEDNWETVKNALEIEED